MDRKWLIKNRLTTRLGGKIYLLLLNDAAEIANAEGLSLVYWFPFFAADFPCFLIFRILFNSNQ